MAPVGLEPKISAGERPQTYALDRAATGTGRVNILRKSKSHLQIQGATRVIQSRFHTKDPRILGVAVDNFSFFGNLALGFVYPCVTLLHLPNRKLRKL
jgi:hypothetical protein